MLAEKLAGKRVLILGDSITENGNYVTYLEYFLNTQLPRLNFDIISIGLGSETTSGQSEKTHGYPRPCILSRVDRALAEIKPHIVFACYGMNDGIYHPQSPERMSAFEKGMSELIRRVKKAGAEMIVITPPPFDRIMNSALQPLGAPDYAFSTAWECYDSVLGDYGAWEMRNQKELGLLAVIDQHTPINAYLAKRRESEPKFSFTADCVHPNNLGHLLMAKIIARALGLKLAADSELDAQKREIDGDPLYALIKQCREVRSCDWLNYIGYTRDQTVKTDEIESTEKMVARFKSAINILKK